MKEDPKMVLLTIDEQEMGGLTEDQYYDFKLDRNYDFNNPNLIQNFS